MNIHIRLKLTIEAELNDTPTAQKIAQALPITASSNPSPATGRVWVGM